MDPISILRKHPLATLCLCYICGAGLQVAAPPRSLPLLAGAGLLGLFAFANSARWRLDWRSPSGQRLCVLLPLVAFAGGFVVSAMRSAVPPDDISRYTTSHFSSVRGVLVSEPRSLPFGVVSEMDCRAVLRESVWRPVTGKTQLWASRNLGSQVSGAPPVQWPAPGELVEVRGVLQPITRGSLASDSLLRHRIFCTLRVGKGGRMTPLPPDEISLEGTFRGGCERAVRWVQEGLSCLEPAERDALAGMLFHKQDNITPGTLDDLQKTGTVHIVATAGLHVGIFMGCCLFILGPLLPRRTAILLTMALLVAYCVACGGWPAVFRATVVAELYLAARLLGRLPDPFTCLSLAAAVMVFLEPNSILDPGFQLTFATVGVILLIMGLLQKPGHQQAKGSRARFLHHLRGIAMLSLAAQLGSWPLVAYYFNTLSFVGFFANLLIVPLLVLIIPLAMVTAILSHVFPTVAVVPGVMLQSLIHFLLWIAHQLAAWPLSSRYVENVPWGAVMFYYVVVVIGAGYLGSRRAPGAEEG